MGVKLRVGEEGDVRVYKMRLEDGYGAMETSTRVGVDAYWKGVSVLRQSEGVTNAMGKGLVGCPWQEELNASSTGFPMLSRFMPLLDGAGQGNTRGRDLPGAISTNIAELLQLCQWQGKREKVEQRRQRAQEDNEELQYRRFFGDSWRWLKAYMPYVQQTVQRMGRGLNRGSMGNPIGGTRSVNTERIDAPRLPAQDMDDADAYEKRPTPTRRRKVPKRRQNGGMMTLQTKYHLCHDLHHARHR